jgi:hypothetical protein
MVIVLPVPMECDTFSPGSGLRPSAVQSLRVCAVNCDSIPSDIVWGLYIIKWKDETEIHLGVVYLVYV